MYSPPPIYHLKNSTRLTDTTPTTSKTGHMQIPLVIEIRLHEILSLYLNSWHSYTRSYGMPILLPRFNRKPWLPPSPPKLKTMTKMRIVFITWIPRSMMWTTIGPSSITCKIWSTQVPSPSISRQLRAYLSILCNRTTRLGCLHNNPSSISHLSVIFYLFPLSSLISFLNHKLWVSFLKVSQHCPKVVSCQLEMSLWCIYWLLDFIIY